MADIEGLDRAAEVAKAAFHPAQTGLKSVEIRAGFNIYIASGKGLAKGKSKRALRTHRQIAGLGFIPETWPKSQDSEPG